MGQFIYYVPGLEGPMTTEDAYRRQLDKLGLGDVLAGTLAKWRECLRGPDDARGMMFTAHAKGSAGSLHVGYKPDEQKWFKGPDGAYWFGYWTDDPPGPDDLERDIPLDRATMTLGDGREWDIPIARYWQGPSALPETFGLSPDGTPERTVETRYRAFSELAAWLHGEIVAAIDDEKMPNPDGDKTFDVICAALGHGYRVGPLEIQALGLINTGNLADVSNAVIGLRTWREILESANEAEKKSDLVDTLD